MGREEKRKSSWSGLMETTSQSLQPSLAHLNCHPLGISDVKKLKSAWYQASAAVSFPSQLLLQGQILYKEPVPLSKKTPACYLQLSSH